MDLGLTDKLFVVTGGTSGFGKAIALSLLNEGAKVILNARGKEKLEEIKQQFPTQVETIAGDITTDATISTMIRMIGRRPLDGILINAGGPPAKSFVATEMDDWDNAFENVLRWKVKLTKAIIPLLSEKKYGRILYIESVSVKMPIENLVLSNSFRLAVVGFVKTLSQEIAHMGITLNILAPGYHATPAMERLYAAKSTLLGISPTEAQDTFRTQTKVGKLGDPAEFASMATWLLSPVAGYITGQVITIDGGLTNNTL